MKQLTAFILIAFAMVSQAQFVPQNIKDAPLVEFYKTPVTYVELTGRPEFDSLYEDALSKFWKINKYEMVTTQQAEKLLGTKGKAVLKPVNFDVVISGNSYAVTRRNYSLSILMGGEEAYTPLDQVAFVCIDQKYHLDAKYYVNLDLDSAFQREKYRIKDMVATLNFALENIKTSDEARISETSAGMHWGVSTAALTCKTCGSSIKALSENVYNKLSTRLKNKTLYLLKDYFKDTRELAKVYPYKFKLVDRTELSKAVSEERKDIAYMVLTHTYWGGITITDPSTHECIGAIHIDRVTTIDDEDLKDVAVIIAKASKGK